MAHRSGVRLVFGTDGGVLPHGQNARELTALVSAGIPAIDAIRAATIDAAQAFGIGGGTLAPGSPADLIAVAGNPLEDPAALAKIVFVMRGGRIVR